MDQIRQYNSMMKLFFHIAHPDELSDEDWVENVKGLKYLADKNMLGPAIGGDNQTSTQ